MRTLGILTLIAGFVLFAAVALIPARAWSAVHERRAAKRPQFDSDAMLWAIRQIESGDDPRAIGPVGERSAYQFTALTWHNHTRAPFLLASSNRQAADLIALRHLLFILGRLQSRELPIEPEFVAAAWRHGAEFALVHARSDYAHRAGNLYRERAKR